MIIKKSVCGFELEKDGVGFSFTSDECFPQENKAFYELEILGDIPVPKTAPGDILYLPVDEGIAIEVDKRYFFDEIYHGKEATEIEASFTSREGTMSMLVLKRNSAYLLIALDSGVGSSYSAVKENGLFALHMHCDILHTVYYGIFDSLPDACKGYRGLKKGEITSLAEKMKKNPALEKLASGAAFWVWNDNYDEIMYSDFNTDKKPGVGPNLLKIAEELHDEGVDNAMTCIFFDTDSKYVEPLYKRFGYVSTQYDNYNDVLNPELLEIIPNNRVNNCGYTKRRLKDYPDGIQQTETGQLCEAWALRGFDGKMYSQNCLCPDIAAKRMIDEIPLILDKYPFYRGRFIDVYGNSLSTCYSKKHPVTIEDCLRIKQNAFTSLSDLGLTVGTEDGFDSIINSLDYAEGLHSPVFFRNDNSGRRHANTYTNTEAEREKVYMTNPKCRVPMWQLVYHDSLLALPYWGNSTDCNPESVKDKILFAALFGAVPLYSFFVKNFDTLKPFIIESYKKITHINRKTICLPMTDYKALKDDNSVMLSVFGDKYFVIANFSSSDFSYDGNVVKPHDLFFGTSVRTNF